MKNISLIVVLLSSVLVLSACTGSQQPENNDPVSIEQETVRDDHTSENALDRAGLYEATIDNTKVEMKLNADLSIDLATTDLSIEDASPITSTGTFVWSDDGTSIIAQLYGAPQAFKVGEDFIYPILSDEMTEDQIDDNTLTKVK